MEQFKINPAELGFNWFQRANLNAHTYYVIPILPSGKPVFPDEAYPFEPVKVNYVPLVGTI